MPGEEVKELREGTLLPAWTSGQKLEAEEEPDLPCIFTSSLHFMEMSHAEALAEFHSQIETQVTPAMREHTDVVKLLRDKGSKVFVPSNWDGIRGIDPIEFEWARDMPSSIFPKVRPISPHLFANATKELQRLCKYLLIPSTSPISSPLVIAPKSTKPFIRICGDYSRINKFIVSGASIIPNVQKELNKIQGFSIYVDLDLVNGFHQCALGPITAARLSLSTPVGQFQPKYLPEGVTPASGILQLHMRTIFANVDEFTVVIFDNLLVLAYDYKDAYKKLDKVLDRCIERNIYLKFTKSWIGIDAVQYFGYECRKDCYQISKARKQAIMDVPRPSSQSAM
jgi:hypothetical protein